MKKIILYGAGHDGIVTMNYLGRNRISYFCDENRCGDSIDGVSIISPDELEEKSENAMIVIAVSKPKYVYEITKKLSEMQLEFVFWQDLVADRIREQGKLFSTLNGRPDFNFNPQLEYIISTDRYNDAGMITSYFWQDLWAARHIFKMRPKMHYDIGSRVDGFITHLLSFKQKVTQIDIRPLAVEVDGYGFIQSDATHLDGIDDDSIDSLSALCSLEHFGLGRYGDEIDPEACFKAFDSIQRVVRSGGYVYISVPIGREHLEFNAHRVFAPQTILNAFGMMDLLEFSSCYGADMDVNIDIHKYDNWDEYGGERYGLFLLRKC